MISESAPRRCPEEEGLKPSTTESARRRCPGVEVPQLEAAGDALTSDHGEDIDEGAGLRLPFLEAVADCAQDVVAAGGVCEPQNVEVLTGFEFG